MIFMSKNNRITILQMNDSHSYFELHPEFYWGENKAYYKKAGGYARIGALFKKIRQEKAGSVLTFDNGDTIIFESYNNEAILTDFLGGDQIQVIATPEAFL